MPGIISIREGGYGRWEDAVANVADAGIHHLEVNLRPLDELERIAAAAGEQGVKILTLSGGVNLDDEASIDATIEAIGMCQKLDVSVFFLSASGSKLDYDVLMARLRNLGEEAAEKGVVLSLETHPPFCRNADGMLRMIEAVACDNVRVNLDTANIFYYNEGLDSAVELERVIDYVASIHLKDTDGGFESPNFPIFGEGIVDFARVFGTLEAADFSGPLTLELEGPVVGGLDVPARCEVVVACMDYLRGLGVV